MSQAKPAERSYEVQKVTVIAKGADVQVRELTVALGEEVPWHFHTNVTDWCRIDPGTEHRVTNGGDTVCRYLLVQSGQYDFNRIETTQADPT